MWTREEKKRRVCGRKCKQERLWKDLWIIRKKRRVGE
jgi:hypothetical protein